MLQILKLIQVSLNNYLKTLQYHINDILLFKMQLDKPQFLLKLSYTYHWINVFTLNQYLILISWFKVWYHCSSHFYYLAVSEVCWQHSPSFQHGFYVGFEWKQKYLLVKHIFQAFTCSKKKLFISKKLRTFRSWLWINKLYFILNTTGCFPVIFILIKT